MAQRIARCIAQRDARHHARGMGTMNVGDTFILHVPSCALVWSLMCVDVSVNVVVAVVVVVSTCALVCLVGGV